MIKVLIVVSGLVMFVPDAPPDPKVIYALLVETQDARRMPLHGMTLHVPAFRQQIDPFSVRSWHINNGDFTATFKVVMNGQAAIGLGAQKDFPQLGQLTTNPDDATIKSDCLTGECIDEHRNKLVAAIVRFEGRWRTRPLLRCETEWTLPVDFKEESQSDFRKLANLGMARIGQAQRPLATGLALETEIENLDTDLNLEINSVPQKLQLTNPATCQAWLGNGVSSCVVLEVENWPVVPIDATCNVENPPAHCRVDKHFSMFYDLIAAPPKEDERWLPYVAGGRVKCPNSPGAGQPPGIRCPPTFACRKPPCGK